VKHLKNNQRNTGLICDVVLQWPFELEWLFEPTAGWALAWQRMQGYLRCSIT
jgi:hypothetical protein